MPKLKMEIQCPECRGTGIYSGMGEGYGTGVVCWKCDGTGKLNYSYIYKEFTGIKRKEGIERVYKSGYGFKIGTGKLKFQGIGQIDMDNEGVSYEEFLAGKKPEHIKTLACPMLADQGACHSKEGFIDKCNELNGGWVHHIPSCKHKKHCFECWVRFEEGEDAKA